MPLGRSLSSSSGNRPGQPTEASAPPPTIGRGRGCSPLPSTTKIASAAWSSPRARSTSWTTVTCTTRTRTGLALLAWPGRRACTAVSVGEEGGGEGQRGGSARRVSSLTRPPQQEKKDKRSTLHGCRKGRAQHCLSFCRTRPETEHISYVNRQSHCSVTQTLEPAARKRQETAVLLRSYILHRMRETTMIAHAVPQKPES